MPGFCCLAIQRTISSGKGEEPEEELEEEPYEELEEELE